MNCRGYQKLINRLQDGMLSDEERARLFEHCDLCSSCREELLMSRQLDALLSNYLKPMEPPADFLSRVMEALPSEPLVQRTVSRIPLWRNLGLAAASLLLVVSVASFGLWPGGMGNPVANNGDTPSGVIVAGNDDENTDTGNVPDLDQNTSGGDNTTGDTAGDNADQNGTTVGTDDTENGATDVPSTTDKDNQGSGLANPDSDPIIDSGEVKLPTVASNTKVWGDFSLTLLAELEGADVLLPTIEADGQINYLTMQNDSYQLWQKTIDDESDPVLLEEEYSGSLTDRESYVDNGDYSVAISPDGTMVAANTKGENAELWLSKNDTDTEPTVYCKDAGGGLLSWAPNSSKLIFDDANGYLYVVYPVEQVVLLVFEGKVDSVVWADDSQTLIFSAKAPGDENSNLYQVTLP